MEEKKLSISVNKAILWGHFWINCPVTVLIVGLPILAFYLSNVYFNRPNLVPISTFGAFAAGFVFAWTWWSYFIVKWRLWAFNSVKAENWPELKRRAIEEKLIWEDGNYFEKTEIRTTKEQAQIDEINEKILKIRVKDILYKHKKSSSIKEKY